MTSILTPQQLNDLVAFQKTLTLATIVGTNERVISAGALDLSRVVLQFGTPKRLARDRAIGRFSLKASCAAPRDRSLPRRTASSSRSPRRRASRWRSSRARSR